MFVSQPGSNGYQIQKSLRIRSASSSYLARTPALAGNQKTFTLSWWMKPGVSAGAIFGTPTTTSPRFQIYMSGPGVGDIECYQQDGGGGVVAWLVTSAKLRDPSAWYHMVLSIDTTQVTASNRIKWYINGVQQTAFSVSTYPAQNTDMLWNAAAVHNIGRVPAGNQWDGHLADLHFIDGQALGSEYFAKTDLVTGSWIPKKYTGTYGTNGFYLDFKDATSTTTLCVDRSGNSNNWTPSGISLTAGATYDSMDDTPTNNFCVMSPLDVATGGTLSEANLRVTGASVNGGVRSTLAVALGSWYCEATVDVDGLSIGVADATTPVTGRLGANVWMYQSVSGNKINNDASGAGVAYGASYTVGDVIGVAVDVASGELTFYKNNVSQGVAYTIPGKTLAFHFADGASAGSARFNFGQRPFTYTPPAGFKALHTGNLPAPTIPNPKKHFDVTTYAGTGVARSVVNAGAMQPGLVWIKDRGAANGHSIVDSVRDLPLVLQSNNTNAEVSAAQQTTALNSNGFSVGTDGSVNANGNTYVAWQWKAGGATVANTHGTLTSQVSVNATAGFSIVTYTGTGANATVGHGLGVAPKIVIVKSRSYAGTQWVVYHANTVSAAYTLYLNLANAQSSVPTVWNSGVPTSNIFNIGTNADTNNSGSTYVAYCFAEVPGYSKIGSYTGNGNADGPFVYCGFRPKYILIKAADVATEWYLWDTERNPYNDAKYVLFPNSSVAETNNTYGIDCVAAGFKIRAPTGYGINNSGGTYIFMAIAEAPLKYANAR